MAKPTSRGRKAKPKIGDKLTKSTVLEGFYSVYPGTPAFEKRGEPHRTIVDMHRLLPISAGYTGTWRITVEFEFTEASELRMYRG